MSSLGLLHPVLTIRFLPCNSVWKVYRFLGLIQERPHITERIVTFRVHASQSKYGAQILTKQLLDGLSNLHAKSRHDRKRVVRQESLHAQMMRIRCGVLC